MAPARPPPSPEVEIREAFAPGRDGAPDVRLVITAPKAAGEGRPGILHVHGGGYVLGTADIQRVIISRRLGVGDRQPEKAGTLS